MMSLETNCMKILRNSSDSLLMGSVIVVFLLFNSSVVVAMIQRIQQRTLTWETMIRYLQHNLNPR